MIVLWHLRVLWSQRPLTGELCKYELTSTVKGARRGWIETIKGWHKYPHFHPSPFPPYNKIQVGIELGEFTMGSQLGWAGNRKLGPNKERLKRVVFQTRPDSVTQALVTHENKSWYHSSCYQNLNQSCLCAFSPSPASSPPSRPSLPSYPGKFQTLNVPPSSYWL